MVWEGGNKGREGGRAGGREGETGAGREPGEGEEAMMLGRQRAPGEEGRVEGGMVDEGNDWGRDEAWTAGGRKRAEEGLSEEGIEQGGKGGKV